MRTCSIEDCERPVYGHGWCNMHWLRWRRTGDPLMVRKPKTNSGSFKKGQVPHNKGVPMSAEQRAKVSAARRGGTSWNRGVPMSESTKAKLRGVPRSEETKAKIKAARARQEVTDEHRQKISQTMTGRTLSAAHVEKISGPNSWRWKGGSSQRPLGKKAWRELRRRVLERDDYTCQKCGTTEGTLVAHHLIHHDEGGPDTEDNLVTWCRSCHARHHSSRHA